MLPTTKQRFIYLPKILNIRRNTLEAKSFVLEDLTTLTNIDTIKLVFIKFNEMINKIRKHFNL